MSEITARLIALPYHVPGLAAVDEDGEPMIFLNARHTWEQNLRTYEHELQHIGRDDFHNALTIEQIETLPSPSSRPPVEVIYKRGLDLYSLQLNHPFWNKLWDIWSLQHEKDILRIVSLPIDGYSQKAAKTMFHTIFAPWLAYEAEKRFAHITLHDDCYDG